MTAHRIHSVFSRRPSVNPEFPSPTVPIHPVAALVRLTPPHPRAVAPAKRSRYPRPSRSSASAMPRSIRAADHANPVHNSPLAIRARPSQSVGRAAALPGPRG
jgi:hypothetical protein